MLHKQDKYNTDKREVNVSAVVPSWVDDRLRLIAFEKRISRSEVISLILANALFEKEPNSEKHD